MDVCVRVPTALRELVGNAHAVDVRVDGDAVTVAAVLDALAASHPELERRVRDEQGKQRTHVNVFVGSDNVRDLDGLATAVPGGAEVSIIPAISGG